MNVDDEAKKVIWSLQNNKRTEAERNVFAPTGKKPMNKTVVYIFSAIGITFLMSFALSQFSKETTQFCFLIDSYCFNSTENPIAYTFYIFMNLWILILGIGIVVLQQQFQLIMITPTLAYPVVFTVENVLIVLGTIISLGFIASLIASSRVSKKLLG